MFCKPLQQKDSVKNIFVFDGYLRDVFAGILGAVTNLCVL